MWSAVSSSSVRDCGVTARAFWLFCDLCCISRWHFLGWSLQILTPSPSLPFCSGEYFHWILSAGGCIQGWFPFAGLPRIPPCYAWCVQAPVQLLKHQFPNSSIGDEFNYLNDKNRKEWKEGLRNCLNSISLTFTSRKKYSSWSTMSANEGLIKGFSFQQDLISVYLQISCIIH